VDAALAAARAVEDLPSLVVARTHIGYGSPHKQDTFHAHGEPLGVEEVRLTKRALGWPEDPSFHVPEEALREFRLSVDRGADHEAEWRRHADAYRVAHAAMADEFERGIAGRLPDDWEAHLPSVAGQMEMATRDAGGDVINALASVVASLVGGSADLDPSTRTALKGHGDFQSLLVAQSGDVPTQGTAGGVWGYAGRNIHFGVREHAMAAVMTGMALSDGNATLVPTVRSSASIVLERRRPVRLSCTSSASPPSMSPRRQRRSCDAGRALRRGMTLTMPNDEADAFVFFGATGDL
jgi:transketolase